MQRTIQLMTIGGDQPSLKTFIISFKIYADALNNLRYNTNVILVDNYASDKTFNIVSAFDKTDIIILTVAFLSNVDLIEKYLNVGNPIILINSESIDRIKVYPWCIHPHIYTHKNLLMIWDYEYDNIIRLKQKTNILIPHYYFPPMYSPILEIEPLKSSKDIDILFYGWVCPRRLKILDSLSHLGINVFIPKYGRRSRGNFPDIQEQNKIIAKSKIIIIIHSYEFDRTIDYYRISPLIANKHFIVHESVNANDTNEEFNRHFTVAPYEDIADACVRVLKMTQEERDESAQKGYDYFKRGHNTVNFVPQALIDFCSK
jgi:hypothetical protein